jgi:hypothetical protein
MRPAANFRFKLLDIASLGAALVIKLRNAWMIKSFPRITSLSAQGVRNVIWRAVL